MTEAGSSWVIAAPAFVLLAVCVYTDLRERRIYDKITIPGMLLFLTVHAVTGSFAQSAAGLLALGVAAYVLAVVSRGRIGGGDIKLYAMIGAAFGWELGAVIFALTSLVSALWAVPLLIVKAIRPLPAALQEVPLAPFAAASAGAAVWLGF